ncbi:MULTISPECIES: LacI family DNA-binding transcriptional regulator [Paraburkholderia]|uniref:LacI family DNA-binding transcriptional regulator n=1 Tax=Paraburkholderia TaxID=1822464 RepID=UPI000DD6F627|nr:MULTISPECIES: LacI family DNA-binding transcriptional regulator [Paraburkholderia]MDH6147357.1 LacI family gluconate utilization system Gnt-I transcriptional repressor [Paraburkholderia sp. WSM4179]
MNSRIPSRERDKEDDLQRKRSKPPQRATIRDVARLSGVSRMTVSRVLSEPDVVLPATRERVAKAIADLGYVPDRAAGSLASRRTGFIALILPTLTNSNFSMVAHGLTEILRERDYDLLIAYTDYDLAEEERQLTNLLARRPEAIVLTGATHRRSAVLSLLRADVPVVEIADLPNQPIEHAVGFSNYEVGRTAARHLISKGFKRIGAIASKNDGDICDHRGEERVCGFEDELRLSGLSTDLVLRNGRAPVSYEHGSTAIGLLLDRAPDIEAVFAVSDLSAVGVVMECQRRGVDVPGQLSVMGFGNFDIGREINPPLTTIHVDFHALGQRAGRLLLELVAGTGEDASEIIDVGLSVVERGSVREANV